MTPGLAFAAFWRLMGFSRAPAPAPMPRPAPRLFACGGIRDGVVYFTPERSARTVIRYPDRRLRHQQLELHMEAPRGWESKIAEEYLRLVTP